MQEVVTAQEKLESAAHQTLAFQRDLALATDRSLASWIAMHFQLL